MRALVTGGAGFVGTNLVKRLLKNGYQVVSFDDYSTGSKENRQDGCTYIDIDITESFTDWVEQFDVIFHLAALPRIKPSFENPKGVCDVNVVGTQNVLEYARKTETPVIYAGSSSFWAGVYKNPYAFSKWQGEELCKMYERIYDLPVTICRFYNVYGNHMANNGEYRTVLPIFLEQSGEGHPLTITGDGEQRRDFTHVDDIVDAMMKVVQLNKWGSTYELGRGENYSINEIADVFYRCNAIPGVTYIDSIPGEARHTLCKSELARKKLKWEPKINVDEWLEGRLCE